MDWPGHKRQRTTLKLYHNNRNGTFADVTKQAGLDVEMYGMGVAVGDYNNDGFPGHFNYVRGAKPAVPQHRQGNFRGRDADQRAAGQAGTSARRRCGSITIATGCWILFVCNYVRWSPEHDVFCSLDGKHKSYCTPEAYRGDTCWLFHNRGEWNV